MATPYKDIYDEFFHKITDYDLFEMEEKDIFAISKKYLHKAILDFNACEQDLTLRDDELEQFEEDLTDMEKEILSNFMVLHWVTPQVFSIQMAKQYLGDTEYRFYSQANHLSELVKLKDHTETKAQELMYQYTYDMGDLGDLR